MGSPVSRETLDASYRLRDAVNLHVHALRAENGGRRERSGYVAIKLSDGSSPDGVLYDTRGDAVAHHRHDKYMCFIKVGGDTMSDQEALLVLVNHRQAFSRGYVIHHEEVITPMLSELLRPYMPNTLDYLGLGRNPR